MHASNAIRVAGGVPQVYGLLSVQRRYLDGSDQLDGSART
jgi:hypothetical protein